MTAWLEPKLNSSDRTKQVDDDSLVTMVIGLGSISFLLLDDDSLPVWDWQRRHVIPQVMTSITALGCSSNIKKTFFFPEKRRSGDKVLRYSQLVRHPPLVWRTRVSQNLDNMKREVLSQVNSNTTNEIRFLFATLVTLPLSSLSMTVCSPFSKEMASAELWNVRPNFLSSTRQ